jgi:hypothetical protein
MPPTVSGHRFFDQRFELEAEHGRGGMGTVWKARSAASRSRALRGLGSVIDRIHTLHSLLARAFASVAAASLWSWMMLLEALAESGDEALRPSYRTYVGLHTPDTDPVSIRIDAVQRLVDPSLK